MARVVAKVLPRSGDNHSFGITDFELLLNSYQTAQLLDFITRHCKSWQDVERFTAPALERCAFSRIRPKCMAGSTGTGKLNVVP